MSKNSWFKHYNKAHEGLTLRTLWDQDEFEAYGLFWVILELVSRYEEVKWSGILKISMSSLQRITGWNYQRLSRVLAKINETSSEVQGIQISINLDKTCEVFVPKWLELQETRGGKRKAKLEQKVGRSKKKEVRSKNEEKKIQKESAPDGAYEIVDNFNHTSGGEIGIKSNTTTVLDEITQLWNTSVTNLPQIASLNDLRKKNIKARLKECDDLELWRKAIVMLDSESWSNGKNDRGWKASIDYLTNPKKFLGLIEQAKSYKKQNNSSPVIFGRTQ